MKEHVKKIRSVFGKILNEAKVGDFVNAGKKNTSDSRNIGQELYDEMLQYFTDLIENRSVGKGMVIHMGYIVWLEPSDYQTIRDELLVIIPEVIDGFYDIIKEQLKTYPKLVPPSTEWFFQITPTDMVPCEETNGKTEEFSKLEKGKFIISSTFHAVSRAWSNVQQQPNVVLSFRPQNSNTMKDLNVNKELMLGIEALQGASWYKFDGSKCGLSLSRDAMLGTLGYATLKFVSAGQNVTYTVKDKNFFVSGVADGRKQSNVLVLPEESVIIGHLVFRYRDEDRHFEVAAYGHTVLNDRVLTLSTRDETRWYRVSAKANFLLGDGVGITFKLNEI